MVAAWRPPQRLRAAALLCALLPVARGGLRPAQRHALLSAVWHAVRAEA